MVPVALAALERRCSACEAKRELAVESSTVEGVDKSNTWCVNDPSAGSPTETLLRLLLPLSDKVH